MIIFHKNSRTWYAQNECDGLADECRIAAPFPLTTTVFIKSAANISRLTGLLTMNAVGSKAVAHRFDCEFLSLVLAVQYDGRGKSSSV